MSSVFASLTLLCLACLAWVICERLLDGATRGAGGDGDAGRLPGGEGDRIVLLIDCQDGAVAGDGTPFGLRVQRLREVGFSTEICPAVEGIVSQLQAQSARLSLTPAHCRILPSSRGLQDAYCGPRALRWSEAAFEEADLLCAVGMAAISGENIAAASDSGLTGRLADALGQTANSALWRTHLALCRDSQTNLGAAYADLKVGIAREPGAWCDAAQYQEAVVSLAIASSTDHPAAAYRGLEAVRKLRMTGAPGDWPLDQLELKLRGTLHSHASFRSDVSRVAPAAANGSGPTVSPSEAFSRLGSGSDTDRDGNAPTALPAAGPSSRA